MKWLGPLRWPMAKLCGPLSVWAMKSVECVPVYRHKPRELTTTFRKSVEAMQAGDNLLVSPKTPMLHLNRPGDQHGRPGELFRGFTMLAQVYYARTGKCCRFVPMLAHKGMRTLSFGTEIHYDPEKHPLRDATRWWRKRKGRCGRCLTGKNGCIRRKKRRKRRSKEARPSRVAKKGQAGRPLQGQGAAPLVGFGATPRPVARATTPEGNSQQRRRQRSVPAR